MSMAYTTSGTAVQTVKFTGISPVDDYYTGTCNFENNNGVFFERDNQSPVAYYKMYYITNDTSDMNVSVSSTRTWFKGDKITLQRTESSKGNFYSNYLGTGKNVYIFSINKQWG